MMTQDEAKLVAARAALDMLPEQGVIGLGSGSTATLFIREVAKLVAQGRKYVGVPTSVSSRDLAIELLIPLLSETGPWQVDVCVDGADEVDPQLNLIKGGGAALTREKIVNQSSRINIIIVDGSKLSNKLGMKWPVPVEVVAFGHQATAAHLSKFGRAQLRLNKDGSTLITDAGGVIYDVHCGPIDNPVELEHALDEIPGVVEVGLFTKRATKVIVAENTGVRTLAPLLAAMSRHYRRVRFTSLTRTQ